MSVIINVIDLPNTCHECTLRNKSMCEATGLYLPTLDERNGCCPLKSIDGLIERIREMPNANPSYWHTGDMVDREDLINLIKEYCEVEE